MGWRKITAPNGVVYLAIEEFLATGLVRQGFTSRRGGVSEGPYSSLNLAFHVGDDPERVRENRRRLAAAAGFNPEKVVTGEQVHGQHVAVVGQEEAGRGALDRESALPATDGLVTAEKGIVLTTFYADCVPLFFLDPVRRVVAVSHAGWRGIAHGIGPRTVEVMVEEAGCRVENIMAGIGPAIDSCCYEVDEKVKDEVTRNFPSLGEVFRPSRPGHFWFDPAGAACRQLLASGIKEENVFRAGMCTSCRRDLFFSHRGEGGKTGRMAAFIGLL